jgi:integrase
MEMEAVQLFLSSIKSPETRLSYSIYFKSFIKILGTDSDLFCGGDPRQIERKIIDFIIDMKTKGKSYGAIHNYTAAALAFYKISDVMLNVTKINKFMPERRKMKKDRAYTHQEISRFLEITDERMRAAILLMSSSGIRMGALPGLRLRHLEDSKLTVYEGTNEEYFAFITPECKNAIDSYLQMRSRYGEVLGPGSFLLREQFDTQDQFQISKARQLTIMMVRCKMMDLQERLGIRSQVALTHGFRKFFTTQLINSKVNPQIREMLLGHKIGLASCYYRPTEEEMYFEYEKAIDRLTINEENRLKLRVRLLESEKTNYEKLDAKIEALARRFLENNTLIGGGEGIGRPPTEQEIQQLLAQRRLKANLRRKAERRMQREL